MAGDSTKANKRKRKENLDDLAEEKRLEALLFGNAAPPVTVRDTEREPEVLDFQFDRLGEQEEPDAGDDDEFEEVDEEAGAAWVDEDDEAVEASILQTSRLRKLRKTRTEEGADKLSGSELEKRLRERYMETAQVGARTDWAAVDDAEDEVKETTSAPLLLSSSRRRLKPGRIELVRCPDANQMDPSRSVVQAVQFHRGSDPDRPLLLTAGLDKSLRFFQIGSEKSEKIHGIHCTYDLPKLPIYSASFLGTTGNVVVSGRRPFFYIYDAVSGSVDLVPKIPGREEKSLETCYSSPDGSMLAFGGNDGYIILVDTKSKQWVADLKMNGSCRSVTFSPSGDRIMASGSDGDVYSWDLRTRKCQGRFSNHDGTIVQSMAATSRHIATGAESGVVNLFNSHAPDGVSSREPLKSVMNLHTSVDDMCFNEDGQILAFSSRRERNSLKLLHVPSATVFSNWPAPRTPLQYVWSMDFSPESKFFAIGNDKGRCLLYRVEHYHKQS